VDFIRACLNDRDSEVCLLAERAFLKTLEGGCSIPVFALATLDDRDIVLTGGLVSLDGRQIVMMQRRGAIGEAETIGLELGKQVLDNDGRELLARIRQQQGGGPATEVVAP